jgi:hypothetical protein
VLYGVQGRLQATLFPPLISRQCDPEEPDAALYIDSSGEPSSMLSAPVMSTSKIATPRCMRDEAQSAICRQAHGMVSVGRKTGFSNVLVYILVVVRTMLVKE